MSYQATFRNLFAFILSLTILSCKGQTTASLSKSPKDESSVVGGPFENREIMAIGMPKQIAATDTSAGWNEKGQKLVVSGTIFQRDGRTPAPGVLLYYYHTTTEGRYVHKPEEPRSMPPNNLGQTHGYLRGWVKSDAKGRYAIYTIRPGVYPARDEPAHIHLTIKEPSIKTSYYIDELVFDDDKLLTTAKRRKMENRGGSGVLRLLQKGELQVGEHDIILGLHIPNYPGEATSSVQSGLQIGEDQPSFTPYHAFGPDKGSRACPVCKYGRYHGIVYFVADQPDWSDIKKWLTFLEGQSVARSKYLKAYFVYGSGKGYNKEDRQRELESIGNELDLKRTALTFVPSFSDSESEADLNKINPAVENTFVIYRQGAIIEKFINLKPTAENFRRFEKVLDTNKGDHFDLDQ